MGDLISFTESPITVTAAKSRVMANPSSVEVGAYDTLDLHLYVIHLQPGSGDVAFQLVVETSMFDKEDTWVELGAFTTVTESPASEKKNLPHLLRYLRWRVKVFEGLDSAVFLLAGILR